MVQGGSRVEANLEIITNIRLLKGRYVSIQLVWIARSFTNDYSLVLHSSPRPSPSVRTVESLAKEHREELAGTGKTKDMSIEGAPDRLVAPVSSETTSMHGARDTVGSTVAASRTPPTPIIRNADRTPRKRKQDKADVNTSQATDKDHLGVPEDNVQQDKRRSVMSSSRMGISGINVSA